MFRLAIPCALAALVPAPANAEAYRAGPLAAWMQNGEFSCEGGDVLLFPGAEFAIVPHAGDDRTNAVIDSRYGRARTGGNAAEDATKVKADPALCAGPVDCGDLDAVGDAMRRCWPEDGPPGRTP
jgi:hypothetical protein